MIVGQIGHVMAALAFGWLVLASYRYVQRRSTVVGAIFAIIILARVAMGLALFWISYLELPIAESLQLGGGFWHLFLDATGHYQSAAGAADGYELFGLEHAVPAPFFVNVLAVWMMAVGISPAASVFLNLCLYALLVVLIVKFFAPVNDWRLDLPCIIGVGAYSFSPVALIHSTQPLKDELACVLVAILCFGVLTVTRLLRRPLTTGHARTAIIGTGSIAIAIFGMAGVRWYFAFIMLCGLALVLAIFAFRERTTSLPRYLTGSISVLVAAWVAFWIGAGPYYQLVGLDLRRLNTSGSSALERVADLPSYLVLRVRIARTGFLTSGGGTNLVIPLRADPAPGEARLEQLRKADQASFGYQVRAAARAKVAAKTAALRASEELALQTPVSASGELALPATAPVTAPVTTRPALPPRAIDLPPDNFGQAVPIDAFEDALAAGWGLVVFFVPISLVEIISGIDVGGGRGLLHVTDVDTVFLDGAILSMFALLWTRRHAIGNRLPLVVLGVILFATAAVLLGYSVTNFGTLWRLRPMVVVPLWVLAVALSPRTESPREAPPPNQQASLP